MSRYLKSYWLDICDPLNFPPENYLITILDTFWNFALASASNLKYV